MRRLELEMPSGGDILHARKYDRNQLGITLLELMITLAIVAILVALAVPSFSSFIADVRQSSLMGELASDIHLARSESIKRNVRVLVCPLGAGNTCGGGTDWATGWVVCYDADHDAACDGPANDNPLKIHGPLGGTVVLTGPAGPIYFMPVGTSGPGPGIAQFNLSNASTGMGSSTRTTTVSPAGSVVTVKNP